jgi:hypothetical protein
LLQLDKALGTSQVLVSGALASLTLSKRSEILDKSSVNETLKDSLIKSSLADKMFGLSLQKVQEEVGKAPQSVRVNVRLNDGKRTIASLSSGYQPTPTFSAKRRKVVRRKQYANSSKTSHAQKSGFKGAQKSGPRPYVVAPSYVIDCSRRKGTTSSFHPCVNSQLNGKREPQTHGFCR